MRRLKTLLVLALLVGPWPALAETEGGPLVGLRLGGSFGQPFGPFGAAFSPELEVGYGFGPMTLFASGHYSAPTAEGELAADPRLPEPSTTTYRLTRQTLAVTLGILYRLDIGSERIFPYASAGPRLFLTRTLVEAEAGGQDFGKNEETASDVGLSVAAGTEYALGPGHLLAELQLAWAAVDGLVLQATNAGALNLFLGYRLRF
ncbi:MAG: hypothetical protein D6729_18895 [Deltaproteobacteria bacterium]|nr:MAG: hypothetical protein D6729_18895 [Deltaproteobacteria bacterium]